MLILIPAYKPDTSLVRLIEDIDTRASAEGITARVLVVNDGSGPDFAPVFGQVERLGARLAPAPSVEHRFTQPGLVSVTVLHLPVNGGKGAALRAGIAWAQQEVPGEVVVTADADGQHLPADILAVGREAEARASAGQKTLVMGVRTLPDSEALQAVVGARVFSALCNFTLNRVLMHDGAPRPQTRVSLVRYGVLAVALLGINAGALEALTWLGLPLLAAKVLVELGLIPVSFAAQRRWVFADSRGSITT